jgi:ABC-type amino acid transport substrate-binding protein
MARVLLVVFSSLIALALADDCTTWYETTQHGPGFRNVSTYGATGNGVTDDTNAIIAALTNGRSPAFTTNDPTIVYFPPGNYLVSRTVGLSPSSL